MSQSSSAQDTLALMRQRHCKRAFLPQAVPREILAEVLSAAAHAPSSKNTQPWQVAVLLGDKVRAFSDLLCQRFDQGQPEQADYVYTPDPWPEGFLERARACGYGLFELKGIERRDREKRHAHNRENFELLHFSRLVIQAQRLVIQAQRLVIIAQSKPFFMDSSCNYPPTRYTEQNRNKWIVHKSSACQNQTLNYQAPTPNPEKSNKFWDPLVFYWLI